MTGRATGRNEVRAQRSPVVRLEHSRSATTLTEGKDVRDYRAAVDTLRDEAMSPAATEVLITKLADDLEAADAD